MQSDSRENQCQEQEMLATKATEITNKIILKAVKQNKGLAEDMLHTINYLRVSLTIQFR